MTKQFFFTEKFQIMRILLILISFFLNVQTIDAQITKSDENKWFHLSQLKEGILFVQLPHTSNKKIEILEKSNKRRDKRILRKELSYLEKHRKEIRSAFKKYYNYSMVYFFHPKNGKKIIAKNYDGILIDSEGNTVTKEIDSLDNKYIAYYGRGHVPGDLDRYFGEGYQINHIENGNLRSIDSSIFYSPGGQSEGPFMDMDILEIRRRRLINYMVYRLNVTLKAGREKLVPIFRMPSN